MKDSNKVFLSEISNFFRLNIGIYITDMSSEKINFLKNIEDSNVKIFDKFPQSTKNNVFFDIKRFFHIVITNDINLIKQTNIHQIKTFAILKDNILTQNEYVKVFVFNEKKSWEDIVLEIKSQIRNYRIEFLEKSCFQLAENIKRNPDIDTVSKLKYELDLVNFLHLQTLKQNFLEQKIKILNDLLKYLPNDITYNIALALNLGFGINKKKEAFAIFEKILPRLTNPNDFADYALLNFSEGNFDKFFEYIKPQAKFVCEEFCNDFQKPYLGEKIDTFDKTLAVYFEKGFGDTFMLCKFINDFQKIFKKVICVVKKPLLEIMQKNFVYQNVQIVSNDNFNFDFDYCITTIGIMSLKDGVIKSFENREKYLHSDEEKTKKYKEFFSKDKFNIGIFWDSQKDKTWKRHTSLENFIPVANLDKVQLYSLHVDKEDFEIKLQDKTIINIGKHFKDFSDTAAAIENCDLIIATDSSVLNLSGALGKKTFGLFNQFAEWQWYKLDGEDVGWYENVKPFHAQEQDNFKPEIEKMIIEIKNLIKQKFN